MAVPRYFEWKRVCLDTTVIIDLLLAQHSECKDDRCLFVKKLIGDLGNKIDSRGNKIVSFYISDVTVAELLDRLSSTSKVSKIIGALSSPNVEFVAFDTEIASFLSETYHSLLQKKALNRFAETVGFKGDLINAREFIYKDFMIIATSDFQGCDVLLTNDVKTMYPAAKEVNVPCALAYPECYEVITVIHQYDDEAAERLYQRTKPKEQFKKKASGVKNPIEATVESGIVRSVGTDDSTAA